MNTAANPLASGNRLQRAYYRWAEPHYQRLGAKNPELRQQIEDTDLLLYTRKGIGLWLGWLCGLGGVLAGLHMAGMPWAWALAIGVSAWLALSLAALSAWLKPEGFLRRRSLLLLVRWLAVLVNSGLAGFVVGHWVRHGRLDLQLLAHRFVDGMRELLPALLLTGLGLVTLLWAIANASRQITQRKLETAKLVSERNAATAQALEADLRLLHAQIHPHFVFNTLATLQHWVDKKDERAGPLLRELTGFLRRSTEMLGRPAVTLAEELQAVRHYLAILGQRMPARLTWSVDMDDALAKRCVPPGLVLTLVENAIEHGLEPKIGGGRLNVSAEARPEGWRLRVRDDGLGLAAGSEEGVGLGNVRRRLQLQHGEAARVTLAAQTEGGTLAEVEFLT